jgi:hypothetical protein
MGEGRRAIEYYEQALAVAREIGDRRAEGSGIEYQGVAMVRRALEIWKSSPES